MLLRQQIGVPELAILGHPNEGKSSVLSTLAEDDSVRVSPVPGETTACRIFPVIIDGREVLRFVDTPGFQNPERVLYEMQLLAAEGESDPVSSFCKKFSNDRTLSDDLELLRPVLRGAGIIYVVDGSRPVRNVDRAEMEILRLTGRPRMAVINCKDDILSHLDSWKSEFRRSFNSNRLFNAHRATYAERILLLEALQSIDQDWQPVLAEVISAFKKDWANRDAMTLDILLAMLDDCLTYRITAACPGDSASEQRRRREELTRQYCGTIVAKEKAAHSKIRALYKHTVFNYQLPEHSILHEDLFSARTWQLLGLSRQQLLFLGACGGAALAAGLDLAVGGASLGLFTAVGGAVGALSAMIGGEQLLKDVKIMGLPLGAEHIQIGPNTKLAMLFVLINRALLYYQHTINWAHGRRDYPPAGRSTDLTVSQAGFTQHWPSGHLRICRAYFSAVSGEGWTSNEQSRDQLRTILAEALHDISHREES